MSEISQNKWDIEIYPGKGLLDIKLKEVWEYRDLLYMFVKRDFISVYKQTILGPLWYFMQPILTMLIFIVVFGNIAKIPTDEIPQPLFYLAGIIMWNYFSECFIQTSDIFYQNSAIFDKVYFPRLIIPISKIVSTIFKFLIQSILFLIVYFYFFIKGSNIEPNSAIFLLPYFIFLMAGLGLGLGIIFSSLTTKYRDLKFLITFGVQLLMYATPVIYPMSIIPDGYREIILLNPIAHLVEGFKYAFLGAGELSFGGMIYTSIFTLTILLVGILLFNKYEQDFIDTI